MAGANSIEITIQARDDASRVLEGLGQNFTKQSRDMQQSAADVTRGVRLLAGGLLTELNPALGGTIVQLASVTSGTRIFGGALGPVAIGLAVVTAGLTAYVSNLNAATAQQAALNIAARSFDAEGIRGKLRGISEEMEQLAIRGTKPLGAIANAFRAVGDAIGLSTSLAEQQGRALGKLAEAAPLNQLVELNKLLLEQGKTFNEIVGIDVSKAYRVNDLQNYLRYVDDLNASLRVQADVEREIISLEGRKSAAAARAIGDESGAQDIESQTQRRLDTARLQASARRQALSYSTFLGTNDIRARQSVLYGAGDRQSPGAVSDYEGTFFGDAGQSAAAEATQTQRQAQQARQVDLATGLLNVERQRLEVLGNLTPQLAIQLTAMETATKLSDDRLTKEQKLLASAEGLLAIQREMASLDATAGFTRGLNEVAQQAERVGDRTYEALRGAFQNAERSWSDGLFAVITGDLKKLPDIGKQFAEGLVRNLTDQFAKLATGGIASVLKGAFGSGNFNLAGGGSLPSGGGFLETLFGGGGSGGGGSILSPTGSPSGSLIMTQGGLGYVTPTGGVQAVGGGGTSIGLGNIPTPPVGSFLTSGGSSYLAAVQATPISAIAQYGFATAVAQTQAGIALGFAVPGGTTLTVTGATAGAPLIVGGAGGSVGGAGVATAGAAGLSAGAAASGVLAGVALGFTIYSALQGPPTAQNIALSAVSGAVSGAVLGGVLGTLISPGIGTIIGAGIGALAGGAAGGGAAALGKEPKKATAGERSEAAAQIAAGNFSGAVDAAASIEDLVAIFNTKWSLYGELQVFTTYQGVFYWAGDFDDPPQAAATSALMIIPEFLDNLHVQVGQTGAPRERTDLADKFRAKRDSLLEILGNVPVGTYETDPLARVTRRSTFPVSQIYGMAPGSGQLGYSTELFKQDLQADDATVAFLIRRIREVGNKQDLDISRQDFLFETK